MGSSEISKKKDEFSFSPFTHLIHNSFETSLHNFKFGEGISKIMTPLNDINSYYLRSSTQKFNLCTPNSSRNQGRSSKFRNSKVNVLEVSEKNSFADYFPFYD